MTLPHVSIFLIKYCIILLGQSMEYPKLYYVLRQSQKSCVPLAWHIVSYGTWTGHSMYSMEYRNIPGSPMVLGLPVHGHGVSQEVLGLAGACIRLWA